MQRMPRLNENLNGHEEECKINKKTNLYIAYSFLTNDQIVKDRLPLTLEVIWRLSIIFKVESSLFKVASTS